MSSDASSSAAIEKVLESETVLETYSIVAEWIRFADAKAAVTLTVNGVLAGVLIPAMKAYLADTATVHPTAWWVGMVEVLFGLWLVGLVASSFFSFLCILPFRGTKRAMAYAQTTHFHPAAIAQKFPLTQLENFVAECDRIGTTGLKREALAALLIDAHLSNEKYGYVAKSIRCLAVSVVFAISFLLTTML